LEEALRWNRDMSYKGGYINGWDFQKIKKGKIGKGVIKKQSGIVEALRLKVK